MHEQLSEFLVTQQARLTSGANVHAALPHIVLLKPANWTLTILVLISFFVLRGNVWRSRQPECDQQPHVFFHVLIK